MSLLFSVILTAVMVSPVFALAHGLRQAQPAPIKGRFNAKTRAFRG